MRSCSGASLKRAQQKHLPFFFSQPFLSQTTHNLNTRPPTTTQDMREAVAGAIALCEEGLAKAAPAPTLTTGERAAGLVALLLAGALFYRAWGLGDGASGGAALLGSGPLLPLPAGFGGLERYLAAVLLLAAMARVVAAAPPATAAA